MTTPRFLEYEIALLLAKYGKSAVLKVLAQKINCSETELEVLLTEIEKQKKAPHHKSTTLASDQLETVVSQHPEKAIQLRALHARFQTELFFLNFAMFNASLNSTRKSLGIQNHVLPHLQSS